jgi:hypothetical protein
MGIMFQYAKFFSGLNNYLVYVNKIVVILSACSGVGHLQSKNQFYGCLSSTIAMGII